MENIHAKAYREVYEILKKVPEEDFKKIPKEVLLMLQIKMDKEYKYKLVNDLDFEKQKMLRETKILLAIIYRDFWATECERDRINKKVNYDVKKCEENKKEKYSPDDIFKNAKRKKEIFLPLRSATAARLKRTTPSSARRTSLGAIRSTTTR